MATAMVGLPSGLGLSPSPRRLVCRGRQWAGLWCHTRENALILNEAWLMISEGPAAATVRGKGPWQLRGGVYTDRGGKGTASPLQSECSVHARRGYLLRILLSFFRSLFLAAIAFRFFLTLGFS